MAEIGLKRAALFLLLIFILLTSVLFLNKDETKPKTKYNLILISIDTLQADSMGIYGYNKKTTPKIDTWAQGATIFTNVHTIFPLTAQSFFTLFTGTDQAITNGNLSVSHPAAIDEYQSKNTIPILLSNNGYKTTAFLTNPVVGNVFNFFRDGVDEFHFINTSNLPDTDGRIYSNTYNDQIELTNQAMQWLDQNKNQDFFLWLHYLNPHHPYNPPHKYICQIEDSCASLETQKYGKELDECNSELSTSYLKGLKTLYDAEILTIDEQVGKILNQIKKLGLDKNSIIVFYADHGEGFDHNIYYHGQSLYESGTKIPLIISLPSGEKRIINGAIDNQDIMPTLLDLMEINYDQKMINGKSLISNGKFRNDIGKTVYLATPDDGSDKHAIIKGDYKLIISKEGKCVDNNSTEELYNLKSDPLETKNIINDIPELTKELKKELEDKLENNKPKIDSGNINDEQIIYQLENLGY